MTALRDAARVSLGGRRMRIDVDEPLEDSVRTLHSVMLAIAEHNGRHDRQGGLSGYRSHLNLASTVRSLTTDHTPAQRTSLASLLSQVLRKTGAAICLHRADPGKNLDPVWFVASSLPQNLVVVAAHVRGNSAGTKPGPSGFDENRFLSREERKLRPDEVGENQAPGEVVTKRQAEGLTRSGKRRPTLTEEQRREAGERLRVIQEERQQEHAQLRDQVYEFVVTAPIPLTAPELPQLFNAEFGTTWHESTFRSVLKELVDAGRLKARKETREERFVRGGGEMPKATGPMIYQLPGDQSLRTRLPDGIAPVKSSNQWHEERRRERDSVERKIMRVIDVPNLTGHARPSTVHRIAEEAGLTSAATEAALKHLVAEGKVFYNPGSNNYSPMHRVRQSTIDRWRNGGAHRPAPPAEAEPEPEAVLPYVIEPAPPPAAEAAPDIAALVRAEVQRAMGTPPPSDHEEFERRQELEAENEQLKLKVHQLEDVVRGLRQAMASMELLGS